MSVNIFTNEGENSLLNKFNGVFDNMINLHAFRAVVGYFRASGYFAVREHLMKVPDVKILVGIDVDHIIKPAFPLCWPFSPNLVMVRSKIHPFGG